MLVECPAPINICGLFNDFRIYRCDLDHTYSTRAHGNRKFTTCLLLLLQVTRTGNIMIYLLYLRWVDIRQINSAWTIPARLPEQQFASSHRQNSTSSYAHGCWLVRFTQELWQAIFVHGRLCWPEQPKCGGNHPLHNDGKIPWQFILVV